MEAEFEAKPESAGAPESASDPPGSRPVDVQGPLRSDRLEEYLAACHRLTGVRFRLVIESDAGAVTAHDSLGNSPGAAFTESTWPIMPSVRIRLVTAPATSDEGTPISLTSTITDPGDETFGYDWQVTKDGNPYTSGSGTTLDFTPDDNGTYQVTLTVNDGDGGVGSDSATIVVGDGSLLPGFERRLFGMSAGQRQMRLRSLRALFAEWISPSFNCNRMAPHSPVVRRGTPAWRYRFRTSSLGNPKRLPSEVVAIASFAGLFSKFALKAASKASCPATCSPLLRLVYCSS